MLKKALKYKFSEKFKLTLLSVSFELLLINLLLPIILIELINMKFLATGVGKQVIYGSCCEIKKQFFTKISRSYNFWYVTATKSTKYDLRSPLLLKFLAFNKFCMLRNKWYSDGARLGLYGGRITS